ncbi:hypothetical protein [Burkholderia seminalis]|uniref:hypothetical protein n=1 Tax=Burkholderia seminalis TaxID=488731 RepID=UPI00158C8C17|nr:hypothetical protein [Burkholderia seminalis]
MIDSKTPQDRIVAARQLYATLKTYIEQPIWTPLQGTLILSGIHPPAECTEIPSGGVGLDGRILSGGDRRFSQARKIWKEWGWRCDNDQESGDITPVELSPFEFICWCQDDQIETEWLRLIEDMIGYNHSSDPVDFMPSAILEYVTHKVNAADVIMSRLGETQSEVGQFEASSVEKKEKSPSRSPMPIPANQEYLSTEELAGVFAVEPQSILKQRSKTGTYNGIRPVKPGRRLLWPVDAVKRSLNGERIDE